MQYTKWLGRAFCLAIALWLAAAAPASANNIGVPTIPFTVQNSSGHSGKLYMYVTGQVPSKGNAWYYLSGTNGDLKPVHEMTKPTSLSLNLGAAKKTDLRLPQMEGMRIYFSFDKPIKITASASGVPGVPAGWVKSDPNYDTVFDWTEFTWADIGSGRTSFGGNATQVDMFGLAMFIQLKGMGPDFTTPVTLKSGFSSTKARGQIFSGIKKAGNPWRKLVLSDKNGGPLRAISPYNGMNLGLFPQNELKDYINDVYKKYETSTVSATTSGVTFKGKVSGKNLVFNQTNGSATFAFPKPDSFTAYTGGITPVDSNNDTYADAVAALMQGALMRTTMLENGNLNACKTDQFYKKDPINEYSATIHQHAYKHLAYGFGYDDTCNQSSYIVVYNPKSIVITLQPL